MTIETRIRRELARAAAQIESVRLRVQGLDEAQRERQVRVVASLEDALDRACRAIERLATSAGVDAERASHDFDDAWIELKTRMRGVVA